MAAEEGADLADRQQLQPVKPPLVNRNDGKADLQLRTKGLELAKLRNWQGGMARS